MTWDDLVQKGNVAFTGAVNKYKDVRQETYTKAGMNERPLLEHIAGVAETTSYADKRPQELGLHGYDKGDSDTMRHQLLSAELQQRHPIQARALLQAHEILGDLGGQDPAERKRDESNNTLGLKIGEVTNNRAEAETMITNTMPRFLPPSSFPQFPPPEPALSKQEQVLMYNRAAINLKTTMSTGPFKEAADRQATWNAEPTLPSVVRP